MLSKYSAHLTCCLFFITAAALSAEIDFKKDVAPIFAEHCLDCHGSDKEKGGLRLDNRLRMLQGGDSGLKTIVPGKPEKSFLIEVIKQLDPDMAMPPKGAPLSDAQIATLKTWIAEGANWPGQMDAVTEKKTSDHWSLQPVTRPALTSSEGNPIDAFLNKALAKKGLKPNAEADSHTLARRAAIILTGIPPTPERSEQFIADFKEDPQSYERYVDELLASPHFGERWAQHWLDVIRWAETNGSEANLYRKNAWTYRDYVVRAFNEDIPYDQFLREQLAGDQLGVGEATGFLVAGPHVPAATVGREPTAIRQAKADRMDEVIQTVGASMLGMTVSCARCHNHKFDPISIQDYYALTAVFQGVEFGGRFPELSKDHPRKKRAAEVYPDLNEERTFLRKNIGLWEENWGGYGDLVFPKATTKALRIEFTSHRVRLDEIEVFGPKDHRKNLAAASFGTVLSEDPEFIDKGSRVSKANDGHYGTMVWKGFFPKESEKKPWIQINFPDTQEVNRFRLSLNREYYFETDYLYSPNKAKLPQYRILAQQDDDSWQELGSSQKARVSLNKNPELKAASQRLHTHIETLENEGPRHAFIGRFDKPEVTKVLHRGSPENPRDEVIPRGFEVLNGDLGLDSSASSPLRRKKFGEWLTQPENPLTARVMANRLWHHLFGTGIVPTTSDFGLAGAPPNHPELLDFLASEFVEKRWSTKAMIRLMITSEAFRRSSEPDSLAMQIDASSVNLWRYPPRRVEAEVIRDSILQASGKLDPKLGGKSFRIHNVKKTYSQWEVVNNHGPQTWRRMLYQERMRRVDDQIFTAFDFPDCGQVRAKRPVSTTPLQALNLLNSPFIVTQSEFIAQRAQQEAGKDPKAQVRRAFALILNRAPSPDELDLSQNITAENGLAIVCRSLINSNEFAFLP